ncbi:MAG: hypothetical protein RID07_15170, partial [Lacipirellulaceae bacterium]
EVKRVTGTRVTIAIQAPRDLRILRGELKQAATEFEIELPEDSQGSEQPAAIASTEKTSEAEDRLRMTIAASDAFLSEHQKLTSLNPTSLDMGNTVIS